ncbi:MAG: hypothetical protein GC205_08295 [Bacteroidetes bacterium]|nr:hypothetical protein [Bacteroidota bacterium]
MFARMMHAWQRWRVTWYPERFQGWGKTRRYFEGWYFKLVSPDEGTALAVIPGIAFDENGEGHSFVQVLDGRRNTAAYHRFPVEAFQPSKDQFALQLGQNSFSRTAMQLDLPDLKGAIQLSQSVPWPVRPFSPGIMGWYAFVPFMECYHGIVSMDSVLQGNLTLQGKDVPFDGGRGYLEKDWGRSFPSSWIWMQSNHFSQNREEASEGGLETRGEGRREGGLENRGEGRREGELETHGEGKREGGIQEHNQISSQHGALSGTQFEGQSGVQQGVSFKASVARIPWLGNAFVGFIGGLWVGGKLYRFTTYTGAKLTKVAVHDGHVEICIQDRTHRLTVHAVRSDGAELVSPVQGLMAGRVSESMSARLRIRLTLHNGAVVFEGEGRNAGLEVAGPYQELLT